MAKKEDEEKGWAEIEVSAEKEKPEKPPKKEVVEEKEPAAEDSEQYGKRVQKRIDRLTAAQRSTEEALLRESQRAEKLERELTDLRKGAVSTNQKSLDIQKVQAEERVKLASAAFEAAYDAGDKGKLGEAQLSLIDAKTDLRDIQRAIASTPPPQKEDEGRQERMQRPAAKVHPKARAWVDSQGWWGKDEDATNYALAVANRLERNGHTPDTDEYYEEIDKAISKRFPEHYEEVDKVTEVEEEEERKPRRQIVSAPSRGTGAKSNVVRLNESEQRMARVMGISLEEYAREKVRVKDARTRGDYVDVDLRKS